MENADTRAAAESGTAPNSTAGRGCEDPLRDPSPLWVTLTAGDFLGVRRGERGLATLFFMYFLLLTTCQYAAKSVRQSSYIDALGAGNLPWVYLLVALVSFPVLVFYSRQTARFDDRTLIIASCVGLAVGLVVFFWAWGIYQGWPLALTFYVWMTIAFGIAVSQFWSYANSIFDPRQARRLFSVICAGGLLGGVPGGQLARWVTEIASTRYTLLAAAILMLVVVALVSAIDRRHPPMVSVRSADLQSRIDDAKSGYQALRGSRLLALIAALMLLMVMVAQTVDIQFYWVIENHTTDLDQRTRVVGDFFTVMGLVGFAFQLLFTPRILRVFGVGAGMRFLPLSVGSATILLMISFGILPAGVFLLAWVLKVGETSFRHSIDQATRELLFLPVEARLRRRAKAFIDVFVQRAGKGLVAILLLPVTFKVVGIEHVGWLTLILVTAWLLVAVPTRREYVAAFRRGLKHGGSPERASLDAEDVTTVVTLVQSLGSDDPRKVLHSLDLLSSHGQSKLVPPLLLHHDDPEVRCQTLRALEEADRTDAESLIKKVIGDEHPDVRSAAIRTLAILKGEDAAAVMLTHLDDPDPRLQAAAVTSLLSGSDKSNEDQANQALQSMLSDGEARVRLEAAKVLGQIREPEGAGSLILLLYDSNIEVVRQAVAAVRTRLSRDERNPIYVPTLVSLMGNRRLKHLAREAVVAFGESAIEALVAFMDSDDEQIWVRRAVPKTIALLGGNSAADALLIRINVPDEVMRAKVIEALAFLRARDEELQFKDAVIGLQVRREVQRYLRCLADLSAVSSMYEAQLERPLAQWRSGRRVPTLLQETLAQRMANAVDNLARLLELILPPTDVRASFRSLASGNSRMRARALEYLDNTLQGSLRRSLFMVIDDTPAEERLRQASKMFDIVVENPERTVERLIRTDEESDPGALALILAALHAVMAERLSALYPLVDEVRTRTSQPLLAETALWVARQTGMELGESAVSVSDKGQEGEEAAVPEMAQIEMVVFFQEIDLFAQCSADQLVQLAAITQERRLEKGQLVYRKNDPSDTLYCVVDGKVELRSDTGVDRVIGSSKRFGVLDVLSDRLRRNEAVSLSDTKVLAIDADDFLDLLSVNIDIVKALFKQLASHLESSSP
ncbi:MAG: cyclic nucleotide-binding domain-containing protein [bacterium]|nr:cyclic nucleotide-binding domain-containing protein [bacterium]